MDKKITRRAVLGTVIAGLAAGPFVIRRLSKNRVIDLPSSLDESFSFPRTFNTELGVGADSDAWPPPPAKEIRSRIFATQKRLWQNYSKIDELKFVLSSSHCRDGKLIPSSHEFDHAEVWFKLGYGVEIKGKNTLGRQVHLVLNVDGEDNQPFDKYRVNLRNYAYTVFAEAFPMYAKGYVEFEDNVSLPKSFKRTYAEPLYPKGLPHSFETLPNGLYSRLTGPADNVQPPWKIFRNNYFSQETGMLELSLVESTVKGFDVCSPLYDARTYQSVDGIYFPLKCSFGKIDKFDNGKAVYIRTKEYSDVRVRYVS